MPDNYTINVLADDFTGAMDAGVQFAKAGLSTALALSKYWEGGTQAQVISSNSRDVGVQMARARLQAAFLLLRSGPVYKKIDSTMRGHIAMEVAATLDATGLEKAVVCPALIQQGRLVRDGRLYIRGQPLSETAFACDPVWPASSSEMRDLVGMPSTHLGLEVVRSGSAALASAVAETPTRAVTVDATTSADLSIIGGATLLGNYLPCGSLGLAVAWAAGIGGSRLGRRRTPARTSAPVLLIVGSCHPTTAAQVSALLRQRDVAEIVMSQAAPDGAEIARADLASALKSGRSAVLRFPDQRIGADAAGELLGQVVCDSAKLLGNVRLGALVIVGGETAGWVCQSFAIDAVRLLGEILVGIPWGRMVGGYADGLLVVTKAGGFGDEHSLVAVHDALRQLEGNSMGRR